MTIRQRKRGGHHFAVTCDAEGCAADTDKAGLTGGGTIRSESSYSLRARLREAGWSTTSARSQPWVPAVVTDFCPEHAPSGDR